MNSIQLIVKCVDLSYEEHNKTVSHESMTLKMVAIVAPYE